MKAKLLFLPILFVAIFALFVPVYAITNAESKQKITNAISAVVPGDLTPVYNKIDSMLNGSWNSIDQYSISINPQSNALSDLAISLDNNATMIPVVANGTIVDGPPVPPPILIEICGNGIDDDGDGLVDEGCPITPPPIPNSPAKDINASKIARVCSVGDIDNNNGLVTQLNLANDYNCEILVIPGDYAYDSGAGVISKLNNAGFDRANTALILGNHDSATLTKNFNSKSLTYGTWNLNPKIGIFGIDANMAYGCSSTQFNALKDQIESSDAWYNIAVIHQPFVTVPDSTHNPNGQFSCYDPMFRGNGVDAVLQAHNHNYQRFDVNGLEYLVVGTGTHDTGSSMYDIPGDDWNGFECLKCETGTNGITVMDFQIDNASERNTNGWFLSNGGDVKDKFNLRD